MGAVCIRKAVQHWQMNWNETQAYHFPLLTRAWVFQERLLSPRVIHFSHNELIWECMGHGGCQCGGFDVRTKAKLSAWNHQSSWHAAVELYTSLNLTFEKDRPNALHGFTNFYAKQIAVSAQDEYFGGRRKTMALDML